MPPRIGNSLIGGRNRAPLDSDEVRRVTNTFVGLYRQANFRHEAGSITRFIVEGSGDGQAGTIIFGPDIYPGPGVADPNSALSMQAAAAHELTHFHRWQDRTELPFGPLDHLDEALTSLEAALRYERNLSQHEMTQLIRDAVQRISLYVQSNLADAAGGVEEPGQPGAELE